MAPQGDGPAPVVLLLHAGAGSKEAWWAPDGLERGAALTRGLLESGYAVFAIDGEHHGERAGSVGFVPITTWYFQHECYLAAADGRIQSVVSASAVFAPSWLFPITHLNLVPALEGRRVLTLVGDSDESVDEASARRFHELLNSEEKDLRVFQARHQPPAESRHFHPPQMRHFQPALTLKLTRLGGHFESKGTGGVHDAKNACGVPGEVPAPLT